jgi:hypothetical protein
MERTDNPTRASRRRPLSALEDVEDPFPNVFETLQVELDEVQASRAAFRRYEDHDLSFTRPR